MSLVTQGRIVHADPLTDLICMYSWPCGEALSIAYCESRFTADAYNAGNYGLFQVWDGWAMKYGLSPSQLFDPETNVWVAHEIWLAQGWKPWACQP